jgi:hypothetical protein
MSGLRSPRFGAPTAKDAEGAAGSAGAGHAVGTPPPSLARRLVHGSRRFVEIPQAERRLLLKAVFTLSVMRLAVWTLPIRWLLRRVLGRRGGSSVPSPHTHPLLVGRAVGRAARLVPRATCLPQALATLWLLAGSGQRGDLRIGVRKGEAGELMAHAWVEHEGRIVVGDIGLAQYTVLPDLEGVLWLR